MRITKIKFLYKFGALLLSLSFLSLGGAPKLFAQGGSISGQVVSPLPPVGTGGPAPSPTILVCPATGSGTPCSPPSSVFSDPGLTQPLSNPTSGDQFGNYSVWVAPGAYIVQVTPIAGVTYSYLVQAVAGTVSSVTITAPSIFSLNGGAGCTITSSGVCNITLVSQPANQVWASPNGVAGQPFFRNSVGADFGAGINAYSVLANCTGIGGAPTFCPLVTNMIPTTLNGTTFTGNVTLVGGTLGGSYGGSPTFTGNVAFSGGVTGNVAFSGAVTTASLNNVNYPTTITGINNSIASFSVTTPGITFISSNVPATALFNTPPSGSAIIDTRFVNGFPALETGADAFYMQLHYDCHAGANAPWETGPFSTTGCIGVDMVADGGGTSGVNSSDALVGIFSGIGRKPTSNRPIWAANFSTNYQSSLSNSVADGLEIDINNSGASDDTGLVGTGLLIVAGGSKNAGVGFAMNGDGVASFQDAIVVQSYANLGLQLSARQTRVADIYIVPPADDGTLSYVLRNAANSTSVLTIDSVGNINTNGVVNASALEATGPPATLTGTGACSTVTILGGGKWAGVAQCTGITGAATLTITPGITTHGWICHVADETLRTNLLQQTGHTTTSCTLSATNVTSNDVFVFSALAF